MRKFIRALALAVVGVTVAAFPGNAKATLIGDEVDLDAFLGTLPIVVERTNPTVGAGVDFNVGSFVSVDITDSSIIFAGLNSGFQVIGSMSFVLTDLDWVDMNGAIVDAVVTGLGTVDFTADSVTLVITDVSVSPDLFARIDLTTSHEISVSEPGTLALLGLGLAGLCFARRRRATPEE